MIESKYKEELFGQEEEYVSLKEFKEMESEETFRIVPLASGKWMEPLKIFLLVKKMEGVYLKKVEVVRIVKGCIMSGISRLQMEEL